MKRWARGVVKAIDRSAGTQIFYAMKTSVGLARSSCVGRARLEVVLAGLRFAANRRPSPARFHVRHQGRRVPFVLPDLAALRTFGEIFLENQYEIADAFEPRVVLDLGANVGASALFYRRRFPEARIVCVEPNPELIDVLRDNTKAIGVEVIHAAVAAQGGKTFFNSSGESWAGSTSRDERTSSSVEVRSLTLDMLIADHAPDLVKMDVEGAEYEVLAAARRLGEVQRVVGEIHSHLGDPRTTRILGGLEHFEVEAERKGGLTVFDARRLPAVNPVRT